jgi:site-specific recombinase XerD
VGRFLTWRETRGIALDELEPFLVASYVEELAAKLAAASVKQHLAALRMLFDYLVVGQVLAHNAAAVVRGPRLVIRTGKTPVLQEDDGDRVTLAHARFTSHGALKAPELRLRWNLERNNACNQTELRQLEAGAFAC